jgi:hypothetical protein
MKNVPAILEATLISLFTGCATIPVVTLSPVGPNPYAPVSTASHGGLQVFSRLTLQNDDQNQDSRDSAWYQHSDYYIYRPDGTLFRRVWNKVGKYEEAPRVVDLPAGQYIVKTKAAGGYWVQVPVTIEDGRTTRLHLDKDWVPPAFIARDELVTLPDGKPAGWRAGPAQ